MKEEIDNIEKQSEIKVSDPIVEIKVKDNFLNPFDEGVTYVEFQKALGKKSIAEYCKGKLSKDQIDWLEKEISIIKEK